jgi:hypothetical protein
MFGATLASFAQACVNLKILAGPESEEIFQGYVFNEWYPVERYVRMYRFIETKFKDPDPIKEKVGAEMMKIWYHFGPGKTIIHKGVDFMRFQTGSEGYLSVVRGDPAKIGRFTLLKLDEAAGRATIESTTPYDKTLERGILWGGLGLCGDLSYIDVNNSRDPRIYEIEFH